MSELEKRPEAAPAPAKSSHKFATFLSYHLEAEWVDELPLAFRVPFKALMTWTKKHQDEVLGAIPDDELDRFFAQYADLLLRMRSDDAVAARIVAFDWSEEELVAFDAFQAHRAEFEQFLEKRASESDEDAPAELAPTQVPGQLDMLEEREYEDVEMPERRGPDGDLIE